MGFKKQQTQEQLDAASAVADALVRFSREAVSEKQVRAIVAELFEQLPPKEIVIKAEDWQARVPGNQQHPMFEKILRLCAAGVNVLLVGPAGCGKTHVAASVAKALNRPFGSLSCTAGASESQLVGRFLPTGDSGRFEYSSTTFIDLYEQGGVFLLDELDAADPNMLLIINSAMANGGFFNDLRRDRPSVNKHQQAVIIGAANTFGNGADVLYTGRSQLDAATLDRWYIVAMDYDTALEITLTGNGAPVRTPWKAADGDTQTWERNALLKWVHKLREDVTSNKLQRVASTRMLQKGLAARSAGVPLAEVCRDLLAGWTKDELAKVGGFPTLDTLRQLGGA